MPTFTITLTDAQVDALQDTFGADVDVAANTQAWVNDWLVQFERASEERMQRDLAEALKTAPAATKNAVDAVLKSYRDSKETPP
jgi:hypothetical protein